MEDEDRKEEKTENNQKESPKSPNSPSRERERGERERSPKRSPSPPRSPPASRRSASPPRSPHSPKSASNEKKPEYKECCKGCLKERRPNGRACICQVPSSQRRSTLGADGCITCGCTGCHPEDLERKHRLGIDDKSKDDKDKERDYDDKRMHRDAPLKNGCCKPCMRAFSETRRACLCQVPIDVRHGVLPEDGCRICGCKGCHPEEILMRKRGIMPKRKPSGRAPAGYYDYHPYRSGSGRRERDFPPPMPSSRYDSYYRPPDPYPYREDPYYNYRGRPAPRYDDRYRERSPYRSGTKETAKERDSKGDRKRERSRSREASPSAKRWEGEDRSTRRED